MAIKDFIENEYNCLDENYLDTVTLSVPVTIRLREDYSLMLQEMANLFKKTRSSIAADFLRISVDEAFTHLSLEDRRKLANNVDYSFQGSKGYWNSQVNALEVLESTIKQEQAA